MIENLRKNPVIAIDGPSGTGKSSVSKLLGQRLGFLTIHTGALYRAIGLLFLREIKNQEPMDFEQEQEFALQLVQDCQLEFTGPGWDLALDDTQAPTQLWILRKGMRENVTDLIHSPEVSMAASKISAFPPVRSVLLNLQRKMGSKGPCIVEGRDIGTVIFPDAELKFFLLAHLDQRAQRRLLELQESQKYLKIEHLKAQILQRDRHDSEREVAPLKKADDALLIDTSELSLEEVVDQMSSLAREKLRSFLEAKIKKKDSD